MILWETTEEIGSEQATLQLDRRKSVRTAPIADGTFVWLEDDRKVPVTVTDESANGIGVSVPDISFELGPRLQVDYNGKRRTASIAHLTRSMDGSYRLGLEWR